EVISPGQVDQLSRKLQLATFEETNVVHLVQKITRFASLHDPVLIRIALENVTQALFVNCDTAKLRRAFENFCKRGRRRRLDTRAVAHASQKRFVHEIPLFEVRREDDEL